MRSGYFGIVRARRTKSWRRASHAWRRIALRRFHQAIDATVSVERRGWLTGAWRPRPATAGAPARLVRLVHARAAAGFFGLEACGESLPEAGAVGVGASAHTVRWRGAAGAADLRGGVGGLGADVGGVGAAIAWEDGTVWESAGPAAARGDRGWSRRTAGPEQEDSAHAELAWGVQFEELMAGASPRMQRAVVML